MESLNMCECVNEVSARKNLLTQFFKFSETLFMLSASKLFQNQNLFHRMNL